MRSEGANFLQRNSALAAEVCRTFVDLDEIEKELKKAAKAIDTASGLTTKYRTRLQALCDNAASSKIEHADYTRSPFGIRSRISALSSGALLAREQALAKSKTGFGGGYGTFGFRCTTTPAI